MFIESEIVLKRLSIVALLERLLNPGELGIEFCVGEAWMQLDLKKDVWLASTIWKILLKLSRQELLNSKIYAC
jgi:hypothetical protein